MLLRPEFFEHVHIEPQRFDLPVRLLLRRRSIEHCVNPQCRREMGKRSDRTGNRTRGIHKRRRCYCRRKRRKRVAGTIFRDESYSDSACPWRIAVSRIERINENEISHRMGRRFSGNLRCALVFQPRRYYEAQRVSRVEKFPP